MSQINKSKKGPFMSSNKDLNDTIIPIKIEDELKSSFLDYAVSVIISRAIPDVRDGLKPVHRRVLYAMEQLGFWHNKPYHKSVGVVGEVLGKFHPHGDQAVYQTIVGMVQDFAKRYPIIDGQGNWGSIDGDNAAAMRYTEIRMQKIAQEFLADLHKDTVEFAPNFDESRVEPTLLPSKIPNLLINGTSGIAVGMATSIPPHNLNEILNGCIALLNNPNLTFEELVSIIPGPDFPMGGIICGRTNIIKAYKEGRGSCTIRGIINQEETEKGIALIITEIPYQCVKSELIIKIAELVKDKVIEGISNIRDESNKKGMRVVIDLKRDAHPETIINQLYKHTQFQTTFSIIMLALLDNQPKIFTLKDALKAFLEHRRSVVLKRTIFDKAKAEAEEHILKALEIVTERIDQTIALIRESKDIEQAQKELKVMFEFSDEQVKAVLELRLQKLIGLERTKIIEERKSLLIKIEALKEILNNQDKRDHEIIKELEQIKLLYGDLRRTKIVGSEIGVFDPSALIVDEEVVITLTSKGYIKRVSLTEYGVQHRGGRGKMGTASLEDSNDIVRDLFIAKNHDELLFFTNFGRIYSKEVYEIPECSRVSKGRAIINILPLADGEIVVKLLSARNLDGLNIVMVTKKGTIKRTIASSFAKIRQTGIRAITLEENDELAFCSLSSGKDSIILVTLNGQGIRFKEPEVRVMGRQASGVRGIRLIKNDIVVGMQVVSDDRDIVFVTEYGFGKRVRVGDFRIAHRGGSGVRTIPTNERNGKVIGLALADNETEMILIDLNGKIIRLNLKEIRTMGRQAQGVRLIRLDLKQKLAAMGVISLSNEQEDAHQRKISNPEIALEEIILDNEILDDSFVDQEELSSELEELEDIKKEIENKKDFFIDEEYDG